MNFRAETTKCVPPNFIARLTQNPIAPAPKSVRPYDTRKIHYILKGQEFLSVLSENDTLCGAMQDKYGNLRLVIPLTSTAYEEYERDELSRMRPADVYFERHTDFNADAICRLCLTNMLRMNGFGDYAKEVFPIAHSITR